MGKTTIDPETETEHNQGEGNDDQEITINGKATALESTTRPIFHVNSLSKSWHYDTSNSASSKSALIHRKLNLNHNQFQEEQVWMIFISNIFHHIKKLIIIVLKIPF